MYWYKQWPGIKTILIGGGVTLLFFASACRPKIENNGAFDLKGFMIKDTARLNKRNIAVLKTVIHNGVTETKKVRIDDWGRELSLFFDADINKPAWKSSYTVIDEDSLLVYRAKEKELKVRELIVKRDKQKVKYILIYTKVENSLYLTTQRLAYFPDSVYEIETKQSVRVIGTNSYSIRGVLSR